jgi:hypothetical protein
MSLFVVAMAKLGYHILLEKPMAVTEDDCRKIKEVRINFFMAKLSYISYANVYLYYVCLYSVLFTVKRLHKESPVKE